MKLLSLCHTAVRAPETRSQRGGLLIRGDAGVMAELRNVVRKKKEVEVLPVVNLSGKSALSAFQIFFVGDATQVKSDKQGLVSWYHRFTAIIVKTSLLLCFLLEEEHLPCLSKALLL